MNNATKRWHLVVDPLDTKYKETDMKTYKTRIVSIALTMMLSLSMVASTALVNPVNAASKLTNPKLTKAVSNASSVSFTWNKVKGAKKYQVATVSYKWKKYRKVAKTDANKKKFTKAGKYKVVVSGKKYQVYKVSKVNYKNKKTLTKNTYTWKKLKANTTYTFAVRAINGKRSSNWVVKRIATKKAVTNSNKSGSSNSGSKSNVHTHKYTRPANKNPLEELLKGKCHEVCSCGDERILYAKWVMTEPETKERIQKHYKLVSVIRINCCNSKCVYEGVSSHLHNKAYYDKDGNFIQGETIYHHDGRDDEKIVEEYNYIHNYNRYNWTFSNIYEIHNYELLCELENETEDWNIVGDWNKYKGIKYNSIEEYCNSKNIPYSMNMSSSQYRDIISTICAFFNRAVSPGHQFWDSAYVEEFDYNERIPGRKEKGYWDFRKGSYNPSSVGWSSTLLNDKELAYGYGVGSYQF